MYFLIVLCDIVCFNCHYIIHSLFYRFNFYLYFLIHVKIIAILILLLLLLYITIVNIITKQSTLCIIMGVY